MVHQNIIKGRRGANVTIWVTFKYRVSSKILDPCRRGSRESDFGQFYCGRGKCMASYNA